MLGAIVLGAALLMFGGFHTKQKPTCYPGPRIVPVIRTIPADTVRHYVKVIRLHSGETVIIKGAFER